MAPSLALTAAWGKDLVRGGNGFFQALHLAGQLSTESGTDVSLDHQRDAAAVTANSLSGALDDVEDSSHSPSIVVNIESVWLGKPDSRTILTAAATASCTEASGGVGPPLAAEAGWPEGATENASNMKSSVSRAGLSQNNLLPRNKGPGGLHCYPDKHGTAL